MSAVTGTGCLALEALETKSPLRLMAWAPSRGCPLALRGLQRSLYLTGDPSPPPWGLPPRNKAYRSFAFLGHGKVRGFSYKLFFHNQGLKSTVSEEDEE